MMKHLPRIVALFLCSVALAWCGAAPARADVVVTIFAGNPVGAGNGTPNLDISGLTQIDTFLYYGPEFGIHSRSNNDPNNAGNWSPLYRGDNYTARITGQFNVAATGNYTFSTTSDDGSVLRIDGNVVVSNNFFQGATTRNGSVLLTAGIHNFELLYFEGGGAANLGVGSVSGGTIPRGFSAADPTNQLPAGVTIVNHDNLPQLEVRVWADNPAARRFDTSTGALVNDNPASFLGTIIAPDINFDYATGSTWSPFGRGNDFSVSITGFLNVGADGDYSFGLNGDDGSWLFVDGVQIVNDGGFHGSNQAANTRGTPRVTGSAFLTAGFHEFEVRMFEAGGGSGVTLFLPAGVGYATAAEVAAIPEPSTLALAGCGLVGCLAGYLRRRKRAAA